MTHNIDAIRATLSLVDIAERAGCELRFVHGEYRSTCPIHHGDNKSGFAIYEKGGRMYWKCFTSDCGQGDEFDFIAALTGKKLPQILDDLDNQKPITPAQRPDDTERRLRELERKVAEQERRLSELEKWRASEPWQRYHDNAPLKAKEAWRQAGVPDEWQSLYRLGGTDSFSYASDNSFYTSPTLTIPIYARGWNCLTVRHRILSPAEPSDKYRPDLPGLGSHPFICDPDLMLDLAIRYIVVEGEKKAIVTYLTLDTMGVQVIGLPGKGIWSQVAEELRGQDVTIILDPDAQDVALKMARSIGGAKVVSLPYKIDDAITAHNLDKSWLKGVLQTGHKVI